MQQHLVERCVIKYYRPEYQSYLSFIIFILELRIMSTNKDSPFNKNDDDDDEITMDECVANRRAKKANTTILPVLLHDSTLHHCYYSITSLFRNHKKVILQDGLTKCRLAHDEGLPVVSSSLSNTFQKQHNSDIDIDATRTGSTDSTINIQVHRQLVNDFDRTTVCDSSSRNNMKKPTTVYHIDTSMVQQDLLPSKTMKKKSQEQEDDDQVTALETPSPVHTDDETDTENDDDVSPRNNPNDEPKHLKFFRRGKLV